ncbi:DUF4124 domain-containing protein [Geotalea sp. SG265]|uniref:DUF4124 domain-containing protein n=1 Tax=Geotalea sp. SG265 TaxID=2922867 RepID=UPI001FAEDEE1|nr:DUF4124 domain-containing protein [Geotalea sp. SG265]
MNRRKFLLLCPLLVLLLHASVQADFYKYKDGKGTVHMTNKLETVPEKYRGTMKVIREDKPSIPTSAPEAGPQAAPDNSTAEKIDVQKQSDMQQPGKFGQLCARFPWLKPLLVVCAIAAAFPIIARLLEFLPSPQLARVVMIAFFLGSFVFVYKVYADHLSSGYVTIKERILTMFKKANEREGLAPEEKAGQPMREQTESNDLKK